MKLTGKRVAVFLEKEFDATEGLYPIMRFREEGAEVVVVGTGSANAYQSRQGLQIDVDRTAAELKGDEFDALVIPGGWAPDKLRQSPDVLRMVQEAWAAQRVIAAICHGPWVLISAGVLKGRTVTSYQGIRDDVTNAGAQWVERRVLRDGNLVTAMKPPDTGDFCRTIIEALTEGRSA
ncbi:MAG: type 1 glutamine amidotransferase [Armatimonadetes bacterium]|nr:type 1 glutamine amidotransferase [Armatimonadota bacterium]